MSTLKPFAALLLASVAACSGSVGSPQPAPSSRSSTPTAGTDVTPAAQPAAHVVRHIRPNEDSVVAIPTEHRWASCKLEAADVSVSDDEAVDVFADDEGVVRLHARTTDPRASAAPMRLDCVCEAGGKFSVAVDIVVDPAAPPPPAVPAPKGRVRPPLAEDPASLAPEDLVARGFPPRPDPIRDPSRYAAWLEMASRSVTLIEPHLVPFGRAHGPAGLPVIENDFLLHDGWSGVALRAPDVAYQWIMGSWNVPSTQNESGFWTTTLLSSWVGLDGYVDSPDVVQAGTEENTSTRFWVSSRSDYAWVEWYPADPSAISNFPVSPGDQIDTWVWMTDANGYYDVHGGYGSFMLYNATQFVLSNVARIAAPPGVSFVGATAEWIVERPGYDTDPYDVTQFSPFTMSQAYAQDSSGTRHDFTTDSASADTLWMVNSSGQLLVACFPGQSETMTFEWFANH